jgi:hypothetical protein
MQIIDPTQGGHEAQMSLGVSPGRLRAGDKTCMLSNGKPNSGELLAGIASQLGWRESVPMFIKSSAARPAESALLDRIARDFEVALVAIGD